MSLDQWMQRMLPRVEQELKDVVNATVAPDYPELSGMLSYHLGWEGPGAGREAQGKRIRPILVLLCAQAAGGDWQAALPAAAAVELLHNFSLIHDDIQDNSPLRRGRATVWKLWGVPQAINAGDVMFTQAFHALRRLSATVSPQAALDAYAILEQTCLKLTEGQYLDMSYETRPRLPIEKYWPMIGGKTSALLGCCAELGALAARAAPEKQASFREFGFALGLAFQVLDDWLGIWGDAGLLGKSTESDLVAGKKSLPVLLGLEKDGAFTRRWDAGPILAEDLPEVVKLLDETGAKEATLDRAEELTRRSLNALALAVPDQEAAASLRELAGSLLARKK